MLLRSDVASAVSRVVGGMSKMDHFIFFLRVERGVSVRDISDITGFSHDRVGSRLKKAYDKIKAELSDGRPA